MNLLLIIMKKLEMYFDEDEIFYAFIEWCMKYLILLILVIYITTIITTKSNFKEYCDKNKWNFTIGYWLIANCNK